MSVNQSASIGRTPASGIALSAACGPGAALSKGPAGARTEAGNTHTKEDSDAGPCCIDYTFGIVYAR